MTQTNQL